MSAAAFEARGLLWEWIADAEDPDAEQRAWKLHYVGGMLEACERLGLLEPAELGAWRGLLAGGDPPRAPVSEVAEAHLEGLLAAVPVLARDAPPDALAPSRRFDGALAALHAAGVVDDASERRWRARHLAAEAPWLSAADVAGLADVDGVYVLGIPPATPEEAAADAGEERRLQRATLRGAARRVHVADRLDRHDRLAVIAVIARAEATDVVFHQVGGPQRSFWDPDPGPAPPALTDDLGGTYEPVFDGPAQSGGSGGSPDRPPAMTGVWRYQPAAPDAARAFVAQSGGARWRLG